MKKRTQRRKAVVYCLVACLSTAESQRGKKPDLACGRIRSAAVLMAARGSPGQHAGNRNRARRGPDIRSILSANFRGGIFHLQRSTYLRQANIFRCPVPQSVRQGDVRVVSQKGGEFNRPNAQSHRNDSESHEKFSSYSGKTTFCVPQEFFLNTSKKFLSRKK